MNKTWTMLPKRQYHAQLEVLAAHLDHQFTFWRP